MTNSRHNMCKAPIKLKTENEHEDRGCVWRPSLLTNKEVEHNEINHLITVVKEAFGDEVKEVEEAKGTVGRTADNLKLSSGQTTD